MAYFHITSYKPHISSKRNAIIIPIVPGRKRGHRARKGQAAAPPSRQTSTRLTLSLLSLTIQTRENVRNEGFYFLSCSGGKLVWDVRRETVLRS